MVDVNSDENILQSVMESSESFARTDSIRRAGIFEKRSLWTENAQKPGHSPQLTSIGTSRFAVRTYIASLHRFGSNYCGKLFGKPFLEPVCVSPTSGTSRPSVGTLVLGKAKSATSIWTVTVEPMWCKSNHNRASLAAATGNNTSLLVTDRDSSCKTSRVSLKVSCAWKVFESICEEYEEFLFREARDVCSNN